MMKELKRILRDECYGRDLEQRKGWYSSAAAAYDQVRPRYPAELVRQVIDITQLSPQSTLLEVGCGPGTATTAFALTGGSMLCLEPNPDFYQLAQHNCSPYPNVVLQNSAFEEWKPEGKHFDAVLAASSFHWIAPEVGYPKAAAVLKPGGHLILLWNKELQPSYDVYQQLSEAYETHIPSLGRVYENRDEQAAILSALGQFMEDSGCFKTIVTGQMESEVTYSVDQYLMLLNTYSTHLRLGSPQKEKLFEALRQRLGRNGDTVELFYRSAFHIGQPIH